jgi:peptidyl-prolyl cis-trans isomerase C
MSRKSLVALVALTLSGAVSAQDETARTANLNPKIMIVNGAPVHAAEVSLMMQNIQGFLSSQGQEATEQEIAQVATQRVVEQKLLAQEAARFSIKPDQQRLDQMMQITVQQAGSRENLQAALAKGGSDLAQLEAMFLEMELGRAFIAQQIQPTIEVTDQEIADYYEKNSERFTRGEQVHARHILFKADLNADEAVHQEARAKAEQARERAVAGADFAELAKEVSEGPSAPSGGDLGFFTKEQMVPTFAEASFALSPGEISPVVKTQFGYHVIKVEERRESGTVPLDEARDPIRRMLVNDKTNVAVAQLIQRLGQEADLQFLDENGNPIPEDEPAPTPAP